MGHPPWPTVAAALQSVTEGPFAALPGAPASRIEPGIFCRCVSTEVLFRPITYKPVMSLEMVSPTQVGQSCPIWAGPITSRATLAQSQSITLLRRLQLSITITQRSMAGQILCSTHRGTPEEVLQPEASPLPVLGHCVTRGMLGNAVHCARSWKVPTVAWPQQVFVTP